MSAQWMGYFFDEAGLKLQGSKLLLCLAIADHADSEGKCWPGVPLLAKKIRLGERQTKQLLKEIIVEGHVENTSGGGRGKRSGLQLKKVSRTALFTPPENVQPVALFKKEKQCNLTDVNGAVPRQETVQSGVSHIKEEPFKEPPIEPKKVKTKTKSAKNDEDLKTRPDLKDQEWLVHLRSLPENRGIDIEGLYRRMLDWCEKRQITPSRRRLLTWLGKEREDVPVTYTPPVSNGNGHRKPVDAGTSVSPIRNLIEPRPAATVPVEQIHAWNAFRDSIRTRINPHVYDTWFKPLIFDGLDGQRMTIKVRTREISHDWITQYYPQQIYDALIAVGLGDFTLEWEIEAEEYEEIVSI
ncbi:hypothetical protein BH10ACI2_BH10ACI2_00070 [soil metagenome]